VINQGWRGDTKTRRGDGECTTNVKKGFVESKFGEREYRKGTGTRLQMGGDRNSVHRAFASPRATKEKKEKRPSPVCLSSVGKERERQEFAQAERHRKGALASSILSAGGGKEEGGGGRRLTNNGKKHRQQKGKRGWLGRERLWDGL